MTDMFIGCKAYIFVLSDRSDMNDVNTLNMFYGGQSFNSNLSK